MRVGPLGIGLQGRISNRLELVVDGSLSFVFPDLTCRSRTSNFSFDVHHDGS